jgi:hypothetical protein
MSSSDRQQTHALYRAATGIGHPNKMLGEKAIVMLDTVYPAS